VRLSRSSWYRAATQSPGRDQAVIDALNKVVEKRPRWGFWKCYDRLRLDGHPWNHKRVYRVYKAMKLNLPRRTKRRLPKRVQQPMVVAARANAGWAMDFMSDVLYHGRRFRTLNILDEGVREVLDIVIDTSIPGGRVVRTLDRLVEWRGKPDAIRVDNGPEYLSEVFADWCRSHHVELRYIQPGKPNQNAYIERFNRTFRHEVLDAYIFESLRQVREITRTWIHDYNEERPHDSLGKLPPAMFRRQTENVRNSTFELSP
jgi:putative transposase